MKRQLFAASLAALSLVCTGFSAAFAEEEDVDTGSPAHFYLGAATGYLRPDGNREGGNTRSLGLKGGYQFNERWAAEIGYQVDAFKPGEDDLAMYDLQFVRFWGNDVRILLEFGYTHVNLNAGSPDDATAGFHIGTGVSGFLTTNLELRGDAKLIHTQNEKMLDGMGTLSLNYHFGRTRPVREEVAPVLAPSVRETEDETLPEMQERQEIVADEPVQAPAPVVEEVVAEEPAVEAAPAPAAVAPAPAPAPVVAPAPVAPAPAPVAAAPAPVPAPAPAPAAPQGPAKSTHTLVNFGSDSLDVGATYGTQLDQISSEIINTNSRAVVEGHTDDEGSAIYNKTLSTDRAIVVKRELKKRGVKGEDLSVVGYGEERPVATNETEEGRAQNRRVEVKVYDKQ